MDEKTVENLKLHQDTVASDANSPLHLIREKEIEISGQMLAAKRQGDEIVAEARKKAAGVLGSAHDEGSALAKKQEEAVRLEVERQVAEIAKQAESEAAALADSIGQRQGKAITFVVDTVMSG